MCSVLLWLYNQFAADSYDPFVDILRGYSHDRIKQRKKWTITMQLDFAKGSLADAIRYITRCACAGGDTRISTAPIFSRYFTIFMNHTRLVFYMRWIIHPGLDVWTRMTYLLNIILDIWHWNFAYSVEIPQWTDKRGRWNPVIRNER